MDELIKWLQDVGPAAGAYPDELYKTGVELCERYSKNQAVKATFRVIRPTPLHKKLLRNTLKSTAELLERRESAAGKTTSAPKKKKKGAGKKKADKSQPPKAPTKTPAKKPAKARAKKAGTQKPTQPKKNAKGTQK